MFLNYITVALRNISKYKFYSFINVFGLALSIASCLLIALYIWDEMSYDHHHQKDSRIHRINYQIGFGGKEYKLATTQAPIGFTMVNDYPQVQQAVRLRSFGSHLVKSNNESIKEENVIYADSTFFEVFSYSTITGNLITALNQPNSVVISESAAKRYFGNEPAVGKVLVFDNTDHYQITAVIRDMPYNAHFRFDFILSMHNVSKSKDQDWLGDINYHTYLLLHKGADPLSVEKSLDRVIEKYVAPQIMQNLRVSIEQFRESGNYISYNLIPLTDIHLYSEFEHELLPGGNIKYIYIFEVIALIILLLACINFINLSTARAAARAKEVGVRKVLGSQRTTLIWQFLTESVIMSLLSFLLAIIILLLVLPSFNKLSDKYLQIPFDNLYVWLILIVSSVLIGIVAGGYPAFFLSAFNPITVLKGRLQGNGKKSPVRNILVTFQFTASITLIICTILVYRQLNYIQTKELGFDKDNVLILEDAYALEEQAKIFRSKVLQIAGVQSSTISSFMPVTSERRDRAFYPEGSKEQSNAVSMQQWGVDHHYINTLGIEIKHGRNFSVEYGSDSASIIVNEAAVELLGYEDPIGKKIYLAADDAPQSSVGYTIIGIMSNFHFESLHKKISPLCLVLEESAGLVAIKLNTPNIASAISAIKQEWTKLAPGQPFNYSFLDHKFTAMYRNEKKIGSLAVCFTVLAITIASLGLFGLAAYMSNQRTKEIGIRKVLGAGIGDVLILLLKDFVKLIAVAFVTAVPLAWWGINQWLNDFSYRISIGYEVFFLAGGITMLVAMFTVSFQTIKAALVNPVKSLKNE